MLAATVLATLLGWIIFAVDRRLHPPGDAIGLRLLRRIDPSRDHIRGPIDAPLILVEYGDFECPFCSKATGSIRDVRARLGDDLCYVFRHLPLEGVPPGGTVRGAGCRGRRCAGPVLGDARPALPPPRRPRARRHPRLRGELGLDLDRFDEDLRTGRYAIRVDDDAIDAESSEVMGTPTFYLGAGDGTPLRHSGPFDADTLIAALAIPAPPLTPTPAGGGLAHTTMTAPRLIDRVQRLALHPLTNLPDRARDAVRRRSPVNAAGDRLEPELRLLLLAMRALVPSSPTRRSSAPARRSTEIPGSSPKRPNRSPSSRT